MEREGLPRRERPDEMPPNRTFFCPFPPTSGPRFGGGGWEFRTEDAVEKRTFLSDGYAVRQNGREALDRRYGEIGISAVAAAVRYQGATQQTARTRDDDRARAEPAA